MPEGGMSDYRRSHLAKGVDYDRDLGEPGFDAYMAGRERDILVRIVPRLFPNRIPRYLDFACGTGRITQLIEPMAEVSLGIDISKSMIAEARGKCRRTVFMVGDPTREQPAIEPVHLVSAFRFFGNAQDELRRSALAAIHALLVSRGFLIINNHRNAWSLHRLLMRCRGESDGANLSYRRLNRLLAECGFQLLRTYGIGFWVVRHRLKRPEALNSPAARFLEPVSNLRVLGPFCPDAVIVARKLG